MHLVVSVPPAAPALSVEDAKAHLRLTSSSEDTLLAGLIAAATGMVEAWLSRALINRTYVYKLDRFPAGPIALPYPPLVSVTSVVYRDTVSSTATVSSSDYEVDTGSTPGRIVPAYGTCWPSALCQPLAVTVTYVAGYGASAALLPPGITQALKMVVGHLYENREASSPITVNELPLGVSYLLAPHRNLAL